MPFETGSTRLSVMAVARIASTALPPAASICKPACAARGCDVATAFAASSGLRGQAYGFVQEKGALAPAAWLSRSAILLRSFMRPPFGSRALLVRQRGRPLGPQAPHSPLLPDASSPAAASALLSSPAPRPVSTPA